MRFCEKEGGCKYDAPVWGTDKNTNIGYCKFHQSDRTDLSKKSITQRAIEKHKSNPKPIRENKKRPGWFDTEVSEKEELNSKIEFSPVPEGGYDAPPSSYALMDEVGQWENPSNESFKNLCDDLDVVTSLLVRHFAADNQGNSTCYICDKPLTIKTSQCMHFMPRRHLGTRWLLSNLKNGCRECNEYKGGNLAEYEARIGKELADNLRETAKEVHKPSQYELKTTLIEYRKALIEQQKRIVINATNKEK